AQTVVLEDYLEIHPERREVLEKYITSGNIRVGPWYLQNDFYLSSGEATIRNLQIGREIANTFGRCGKVGYMPDQFGLPTQIPQIFAGFGIDHFVFGRGYQKYTLNETGELCGVRLPTEFIWEGPDGSQATTTFMPLFYCNAQHISSEPEKARALFDSIERIFSPMQTTPYILMMNGVDHFEPQADVREIIAGLREQGVDARQSGLDEYADLQDEALVGQELSIVRGALNYGKDNQILRGCWSSRVYLKRETVRAQDALEHKLEPLYAYLENGGFRKTYPKAELRYLWKCLLKNLPHDSVCGCSADAVHRHMENRFEEIGELTEELLSRGLQALAHHSAHPAAKDGGYCVALFNPTARTQSGVAECTLRLRTEDGIDAFALVDERGNEVPYEIVERSRGQVDLFSPLNLPGTAEMDSIKIRLLAANIPPYTATTYAVEPREESTALPAPAARDYIENEYYRIGVENGRLTVTDLRTGKTYVDPIRVEDSTDRGDAYVYRFLPGEVATVVSPTVGVAEIGALAETIELCYTYARPATLDSETHLPTDKMAEIKMRLRLTLAKGSDAVAVSYGFVNTAENHRTRIALDSGILGGKLYTDSPFDVDEREPHRFCPQSDSDTQCNSTFASITDGARRFTVFTEGQHEVEQVGETLYVTVLRATGHININHRTLELIGAERWSIPGNQCLRPLSGRFAFSFGGADTAANLFEAAKFFRCGFLSTGEAFDIKKLTGGRIADQHPELSGLFYLPDPNAGRTIPSAPLLTVDNEEIAVTCAKTGNSHGQIIRLVNLSATPAEATLTFSGRAFSTTLAEDADTYIGENGCRLTFGPKQIITLRIVKTEVDQ
ncbi:MAG: hypothetical protein IJ012_02535, partial [Clostridia bacterium]|nr:hypothetical protein [Clostridia bacterium]